MDVRPSTIAGSWYPANPDNLTQALDHYLAEAVVDLPAGKIWGVVAPHAGYIYSGPVAAYAFKLLQNLQPHLVVVISPLHRNHYAPLLTTTHEAFQTPLGLIEVDRLAVAQLDRVLHNRFDYELTPVSRDREHSLEIELPFLQRTLGEFQLLPVMMREQGGRTAEALGLALAEILTGREVLFVASSDLSHFYEHKLACRLDGELLRRLEAFDPRGVLEAEAEGAGFACGRGAIAAMLWATRELGANRVSILHHATSGDVSGDYQSVVGYGAAVVWQSDENGQQA